MIIRTVITCLISAYAIFITMRYNMHMFQLNGYKSGEHINWLKKNLRMQWVLVAALILGALRIFVNHIAVDIIIWLWLWLVIVVYRAMRRMKAKKKLVYTARVKRMLVTMAVLIAAITAVVAIFCGIGPLTGVLMIIIGAQWFFNIIANIINRPIELLINRHYINDAKRILKSCKDLTVIGVTGSYGKTSVKFYLQTLLKESFNTLVTPESYNTPMGVVKTIRGSLKPTHEIFVCEMGARHVGDIKEICDIVHPQHGIITSVGPQHLETFFNMENIKKTKFELADALPEGGMLFLNGDNEYIRQQAEGYKNIVYYTNQEDGGYHAGDIKLSQTGTEFTVTAPDGEREVFNTRLIGSHNVINIVGAIAVANKLGIPLKNLRIPVRRIESVPHRMELKDHGNVTIIDDAYNSNPIGSKAAVETLKMFDGIRILITPGMVELGEKEYEYNRLFGTYAADCCNYILLVGKKRAEPIREGVLSKGFPEAKCLVYDKLEDAVQFAYGIKGQGHKYILLENDLPDNY